MIPQLTRYVIRELLKVFLTTLIGLSLLLIVVVLAHQAIREGLGPVAIIRMVPYVVPNALRIAIPGTVLFATCSVYGRMSAANEIVAVKSLGISPISVIRPALVLSFVLSLVAVWLNDVAVSWGRLGINRVVLQSAEQIMYGVLRTQSSYSNGRFSISVSHVDDQWLMYPTIDFHGDGDNHGMTLTAHRARLRYNEDENTLSLLLEDSEFDVGKTQGRWTGQFEHRLPLSAVAQKDKHVGPSEFALRQIPAKIVTQRELIQQHEQQLAADAGYALLTGNVRDLAMPIWQPRHAQLNGARSLLNRLRTEPWRRWANGFCCFAFVLVGSTLAIRLRNADFWTSFGLCFLPILLVYYPVLQLGVSGGKSGQLPPYAVWGANLLVMAVGGWFLRKVMRY